MLRNINDIYYVKLAAKDGTIGQVKDFYFDEVSWSIRYLIADTGTWLPGRQVLLPPNAFNGFRPAGEVLQANLTKKEIENSPSIKSHQPVTRQQERDYYEYYQWPAYWETSGMRGLREMKPPVEITAANDPLDDIHLRSTRAITGYDLRATDGTLGTVSGFLVDHLSWSIADLVIETGHWYAGTQILISPAQVLGISYSDAEVSVKLSRADLERIHGDEAAKLACNN